MSNKVIVILGPTASGKTGLAVKLAQELGGEIISADSRQVYIGMDIGTGKDLINYELQITNDETGKTETVKIPYHLIDVAEPNDKFDVAQFKQQAEQAIADIFKRGKQPIVVGGSGLYLQALVDNYQLSDIKPDESLRADLESKTLAQLQTLLAKQNQGFFDKLNNSDQNNKRRLIRYIEITGTQQTTNNKQQGGVKKDNAKYDFLLIGLVWPKEVLQERITKRLKDRLEKENMIEEVQALSRRGVSWQRLESFGLEYKFIAQYLQDKLDYEDMVAKLNIAINQFAKRQLTWFKRWAKQGAKIHWVDSFEEASIIIGDFLK